MWDEGKSSQQHQGARDIPKRRCLQMTWPLPTCLGEFLASKYALGLDLRTTDDDQFHHGGRCLATASEDVTIQITKTAEAAGTLNICLYVNKDAQLNTEDGRFVSAIH